MTAGEARLEDDARVVGLEGPVYPNAASILDGNKDAEMLVVHRSLRAEIPHAIAFVVAVVLVFALNIWFRSRGMRISIPLLGGFSVRWFSLIPAAILLELVRKYHDQLYRFRPTRIEAEDGRFSLNYQSPMLRYTDLRAVQINQNLIGRLFDYGDIALSTAGTDQAEMVLRGVAQPAELAALIEDLRRKSLLAQAKSVPAASAEVLGDELQND